MHQRPGSDLADCVAEIETASMRAESLTKQMLAYSGRGAFVVKPMDLNATVRDVSELLGSAVSKNAILQRSFTESLPSIQADDTQVRQVLMNLIMNASDALDGKPGAVSLRTGLVDVSADALRDYLSGNRMGAGTFVYVEVEDAGVGMDAETQRRMFDPFFTTKASGRGLGLSAALGIVQGQHGGLRVRSEVGVGTCIRVLFPAVFGVRPAEPRLESRIRRIGIGGMALVVDDEESVLKVGSEILRRCRMSVIPARDGAEAVEVFEKHRTEIGVVLFDLSMPRMDGRTAAKKIRQIDSAARVILMSGYDEVEATRRFEESCCDAFLQKPFTVASLMETVQRLARPEEREGSD